MRSFSTFCLLIISCLGMQAGEVEESLPMAKAIWKASLDRKTIALTITNTGPNAFQFFPKLEVYAFDPRPTKLDFPNSLIGVKPDLDNVPSTMPPELSSKDISKIVFPILEFTNFEFPGFGFDIGGLTTIPVEIKAGETKEFKFLIFDPAVKHIMASKEVVFLLRSNSREINRKMVKRKKDIPWMQ